MRPGEFWPPTLPNGRFFAQALRASAVQEIFEVTDAGLIGGGVNFRWGDIVGFVWAR